MMINQHSQQQLIIIIQYIIFFEEQQQNINLLILDTSVFHIKLKKFNILDYKQKMTDSEMQDMLICKPRFLEKGPDIQTKLQMSINYAEQDQKIERPAPSVYEKYAEMQEYFCPLDQLERLLKTNFSIGLSSEEASKRQQSKSIDVSDWKMFIKELNLFAFDLIIATMISISLAIYGSQNNLEFSGEEIITSCLLLIVITITFAMGYQQRKKSQYAIEKDNEQIITVYRDGKMQHIQVQNLVSGDICVIKEGLVIYCDMRVLESSDLQIQMNQDITQAIKGSQIFCGSLIRSGFGKAVVIKTGSSTTIAQIQKRQGSKLLQKQLILFQQIMTLIALFVIILVIIWSSVMSEIDTSNVFAYGFRVVEQVIIAIVPVGLLVIVTISFQMAIRRLAKLRFLIKDAESIERLSEINCLCIGLNEVITSKNYTFNSFNDCKQLLYECRKYNSIHLYYCAILTCNHTNLDGTEKCIIDCFKDDDTDSLIKNTKYYVNGIQYHLPFNSSKKYSLSIVEQGQKYFVYIKGAPEVIWNYCNKTLFDKIDIKQTQLFNEQLVNQCSKGLRSIGFAYLEIENEEDLKINENDYEFNKQNFVYLGTLYLNNSLNEQTIPILEKLQSQNIKLVIITGEHPETARIICKNTGYYNNPTIIEGHQLYLHVDDQQEVTRLSSVENKLGNWCSQQEIVFARTSPEQKLSIVKALQQLNYKVAITGEGLTDLGAFRQADISISKKHGSQQMIINSSDLVLTSSKQTFLDSYQAILESKRAVNNVIKSIMLCLSSNTAMILALFVYCFLGTPLPFSQNLMLLTSISVDLILGISLAREELEYRIPNRTNLFLFAILIIGCIEAGGGLMASFSAYRYFGFNLQNLYFTRFARVYPVGNQDIYNPLSNTLGNSNLIDNCLYNGEMQNYQWSSPNNTIDQRLIFVQCGTCSELQIQNGYLTDCWNTKYEYPNCLSNLQYCYTAKASDYASTSFYIVLVLSQCINYFALRTLIKSYNSTRINTLAIYGLTISLIILPIIVYVPGIQWVFQTVNMPWELLGSAGLPFCLLLLAIAEIIKWLLRTYVGFQIL
ncbi:unnamed protein product [Paramecium primaurelia]|uniref:Cation-transporting P-type ATPase C-terminal domain-containing protein n=1 Tax=Paramecium primaurelia TaxID=5886 RepID=A0A8S1MWU2_PARPR|nr:unnamed protein product [Paramecium primaurelia]